MKLSNNCPHWILFDLRRTIESLDGESVRVCVCVFFVRFGNPKTTTKSPILEQL